MKRRTFIKIAVGASAATLVLVGLENHSVSLLKRLKRNSPMGFDLLVCLPPTPIIPRHPTESELNKWDTNADLRIENQLHEISSWARNNGFTTKIISQEPWFDWPGSIQLSARTINNQRMEYSIVKFTKV